MATASAPIAVFDSGVGGLSVLRVLERELPHERFLYMGDSAFAPYGDKTEAWIASRCLALAQQFQAMGAKALVLACNTATGAAANLLRERLPLPIIGMEPALKPALTLTQTGRVGVLATARTLAAQRFFDLTQRVMAQREAALLEQGLSVSPVHIHTQACVGFVEKVEAGRLSEPDTRALIREHTAQMVQAGVDVWVLGCTHYPFLAKTLQQELLAQGASAAHAEHILDPAPAVARELKRRLTVANLLAESSSSQGDLAMSKGDVSNRTQFFSTAVSTLDFHTALYGQLMGRAVQLKVWP